MYVPALDLGKEKEDKNFKSTITKRRKLCQKQGVRKISKPEQKSSAKG